MNFLYKGSPPFCLDFGVPYTVHVLYCFRGIDGISNIVLNTCPSKSFHLLLKSGLGA